MSWIKKEASIMSTMLRIVKNMYRTVVPSFIRQYPLVIKLKGLLPHNVIYDSDYYGRFVDDPAVRSSRTISDSIVAEFTPKTVIDVGCGTGALLGALRERGCEVFGLEYSKGALEYCRARKLNVVEFDLERDFVDDDTTYDVAVSMEVAEHLPERSADRYVDLLSHLSRVIVFTAAPPCQGGMDHVNEQPPLYWIRKFQQRGFRHAEELSRRWQESWRVASDVESWYYRNLMIFQKDIML
jgi:SAM-dependent methyltransferase